MLRNHSGIVQYKNAYYILHILVNQLNKKMVKQQNKLP